MAHSLGFALPFSFTVTFAHMAYPYMPICVSAMSYQRYINVSLHFIIVLTTSSFSVLAVALCNADTINPLCAQVTLVDWFFGIQL